MSTTTRRVGVPGWLRRKPFMGWHDWRLGALYWTLIAVSVGMSVYGLTR